jgi:transcriptional regulator with XRE-family HTH domain
MNKAQTMQDVGRVPQPMGPRIRVAREEAGLTAEQLAQRLGVGLDSVLAWEADQRTPRVSRLLGIAGIVDASLAWLLEGREDGHRRSHRHPSPPNIRQQLARLGTLLSEAQEQLRGVQRQLEELEESRDMEG